MLFISMTCANDVRLIVCKKVRNQFKIILVVVTNMLTVECLVFALYLFKGSIDTFCNAFSPRILKSNMVVEAYLSCSSVLSIPLVHKSMVETITG